MTQSKSELLAAVKPCPFCGGIDIRFDRHEHTRESPTGVIWSMCCYHCGAQVPNRYKKELLVDAWNKRALAASAPGHAELLDTLEMMAQDFDDAGKKQSGATLRQAADAIAAQLAQEKKL
jgi:Lar family restriction alleviation protein